MGSHLAPHVCSSVRRPPSSPAPETNFLNFLNQGFIYVFSHVLEVAVLHLFLEADTLLSVPVLYLLLTAGQVGWPERGVWDMDSGRRQSVGQRPKHRKPALLGTVP